MSFVKYFLKKQDTCITSCMFQTLQCVWRRGTVHNF